MNRKNITKHLNHQTKYYLHDIALFDDVSSTQDILLDNFNIEKVTAVFAESQSAGRGRRGRTWISPPGTNIYLSLSWPFNKTTQKLSGLSCVIAIALCNAFKQCGITECIQIKWPNDLFFENKKFAGILVETQSGANAKCTAMIGIGINVKLTTTQAKSIDQPWTTLEAISGQRIDREKLAGLLLNALVETLVEFEQSGLSSFNDTWKTLDALFGKRCTVTKGNTEIYGEACGITSVGEMILKMDDGQVQYLHSGEVKMRMPSPQPSPASGRGSK